MSLHEKPQIFNHELKDDPKVIDLIEYMAAHHQQEASSLAQLARWHTEQAQALAAERRALAADVTEVLRQAERVLA